LVSGVTGLVLLTTKDTVAIDTPAARATSRMVAIVVLRSPARIQRCIDVIWLKQQTLPQLS
jgi:hypothetical protein